MTTLKPSDVDLAYPHFVGCAERAECEFALAAFVRTCQVNGDQWQAIGPRDVGKILKADVQNEKQPFAKLMSNPFFFMDFRDLVVRGYARYTTENEDHSPIELTEKGFGAIEKWVSIRGKAHSMNG